MAQSAGAWSLRNDGKPRKLLEHASATNVKLAQEKMWEGKGRYDQKVRRLSPSEDWYASKLKDSSW